MTVDQISQQYHVIYDYEAQCGGSFTKHDSCIVLDLGLIAPLGAVLLHPLPTNISCVLSSASTIVHFPYIPSG